MSHDPVIQSLAADLGIPTETRRKFRTRGVPHRHRLPILRLAAQRGIAIPDEAFDAPTSSRAPAPDASNNGSA